MLALVKPISSTPNDVPASTLTRPRTILGRAVRPIWGNPADGRRGGRRIIGVNNTGMSAQPDSNRQRGQGQQYDQQHDDNLTFEHHIGS